MRRLTMTTRPQLIPGSTKRARLTIVHRCWLSVLTAAATAILYIGFIIAAAAGAEAEAAENKSTSSDPVPLVCSGYLRKMSFNASSTWQQVVVYGTDKTFTGNCEVDIAFSSSTTDLSLANLDWPLSLQVKMHGLQLLPASSKCMFGSLILVLYSGISFESMANLCDAYSVDSWYIWVSQPVRVYLYAWPTSDIRASFSVAFVTVRAFDVCQTFTSPSKMLRVDKESYVFAPHSVFVSFLKNGTVCSGTKQLRLAVSSPFNALSVTVFAAPTNSSCWSLWLDELRMDAVGAGSFVFAAHVTVLYALNDSASGCNGSSFQEGFTIKASAVSTVSPETISSTGVLQHSLGDSAGRNVQDNTTQRKDVPDRTNMVAAAASTASVVSVLALIGSFVLYWRRRRLTRKRMLQEENSRKQREMTVSTSSEYEQVCPRDEQHEYSALDGDISYERLSSDVAQPSYSSLSCVSASYIPSLGAVSGSKDSDDEIENPQTVHVDEALGVDEERRHELEVISDEYEQAYDMQSH